MPIGWAIAAANRNDCLLLPPTLDAVAQRGLLFDIETLHLDRGYDDKIVRGVCAGHGLTDVVISLKRKKGQAKTRKLLPMGERWPVERTNSWFTNFGQLRRSTDPAPYIAWPCWPSRPPSSWWSTSSSGRIAGTADPALDHCRLIPQSLASGSPWPRLFASQRPPTAGQHYPPGPQQWSRTSCPATSPLNPAPSSLSARALTGAHSSGNSRQPLVE
ncbi:MAG: transposase family protein [Candidatus Dormibacteria bacterium]